MRNPTTKIRLNDFIILLCSHPSLFTPLRAHSLNHLIRSRQQVRRNRQADLLRRFQIDDELELLRLLHGKVGGPGAFQNLLYVCGGAMEQVSNTRTVKQEPTSVHIVALRVYRRETALGRELYNLCSLRKGD